MDVEDGVGEHTQDGTVDLKGKRVLRSKRGGWKACSFVVVYEVFERMAYYGISSNLFIYMTQKLHQGTVTSSNNVTNWSGTIWMTPVIGAYIADAHLGRYWTFVVASAIYLSGMILLTLSVSLPGLKPPSCNSTDVVALCKKPSKVELGVYFLALYTLTVGTGGTKPNISTIGADQFDEFKPKGKAHKLSFFNWWMFIVFFGTLFANTVLVWIQDNVGWTLGYGLPTFGLAISIAIFLAGTPSYRHRVPNGNPITEMSKVIVAAIRNWDVRLPSDPKELYELASAEYEKKGKLRIDSTHSLRFLNKACVKTHLSGPWTLCPVTQVEETKQMLRMLPILIATFIPSTMVAQVNTLFVKQGTTLERHIGSSFNIPPASLAAFMTISMLVSLVLYDRFFVSFMKRLTGNPRGVTMLQRMGIGLAFHIAIMMIASLTERYRLEVAKDNGAHIAQVPRTIFILLPQFVLMGIADAFLVVAKTEFFYDQAPESMKSLGTSYSTTSLGIGNFLSSFLLTTVNGISKKRNGGKAWIQNNLNTSHLDYYYAFLAILSFWNFILFLVLSRSYVYRAEVPDYAAVLQPELSTTAPAPAGENQEDESGSL